MDSPTTTALRPAPDLPPLPYEEWQRTRETLHLYLQIVGKFRLAATPPHNHWWHVPYYVSPRGLTARPMRLDGEDISVSFDFLTHRFLARASTGEARSVGLRDGLSVSEFYLAVSEALRSFGLDLAIRARPYGLPVTTPFAEDVEHASYDAEYVQRWWRILRFVHNTFEEFAGRFSGKQSPVHLFWHSFDLAVTRFSGRVAPARDDLDGVGREAYSHENISFGFWPGDRNVRAPAFYSYTSPAPDDLQEQTLRPSEAHWDERGSARLWYDDIRAAADPRTALLDFLESAYEAGATTAGWDIAALRSRFAPVTA